MARKKRSVSVKVDLSDVEVMKAREEGDYVLTVAKATVEQSQEGNDYVKWEFDIEGGGKVWENTSLQPQALWKLRSTLEALGVDIPSKAFDFDPSEYEGMQMGATLEVEKYQGKKKNVISDAYPFEEEDDDEEKPKAKKSNKKQKNKKEDDEEDDEESKSKKVKSKKAKKPGSKITKGTQVCFEDEDEEYEGEVLSINKKEGLAVIETEDGDQWEIDLEDLTLV